MASQSSNAPISPTRLKQIAMDACQSAIGSAEFYEHPKVEGWNSTIINSILKAIISESTPSGSQTPTHKYVVNSTIVQHLVPTSALNKPKGGSEAKADSPRISTGDGSGGATATDGKPHVGRRGMHSATQAFWNEKTDGMWSFKYDGGESKGMDVVISVIWIGI
ncbi:Tctex-1 [Durotheca rogersii]|uniref:Tctex-1 n=1 Tax=Durotheca rogersii TaxID=419775 RepID=UPI00221F8F4D|nr:Tctex-1 [Durotheca rogersii]KAI5860220.1 Tctex-1 [Durotheca rogersii]